MKTVRFGIDRDPIDHRKFPEQLLKLSSVGDHFNPAVEGCPQPQIIPKILPMSTRVSAKK
jgi:hypothetical protein